MLRCLATGPGDISSSCDRAVACLPAIDAQAVRLNSMMAFRTNCARVMAGIQTKASGPFSARGSGVFAKRVIPSTHWTRFAGRWPGGGVPGLPGPFCQGRRQSDFH